MDRTSELRKPESFKPGEIVLVRSERTNLWTVRCRVEQVREHGGLATSSYVLTNLSTGKSLTRNERLIRKRGGMKINGLLVRTDLVLPSDKVRNRDDYQDTGTDLEPEKAMSVQVKHIIAEHRSPGAGILRCHERDPARGGRVN